jgi:hypothetical protein
VFGCLRLFYLFIYLLPISPHYRCSLGKQVTEILSASAAGSGALVASRPDEDRPKLFQRHHRQGRRVSCKKDRFGVPHVHTPSLVIGSPANKTEKVHAPHEHFFSISQGGRPETAIVYIDGWFDFNDLQSY